MIKVKRIRKECLSCNDLLPRVKELPEKNEEDALPPGDIAKIQDMLLMHCYSCALEKSGIHIGVGRSRTFNRGAGGGKRVIRDTKTL
jgi:hypothetical protein